jgi:hypothetical protein
VARTTSLSGRARQAWTIARIELRRVFFAKRGLWVYALALLPAIAFCGHGIDVKLQRDRLSRGGVIDAAAMNTPELGETADSVSARLGKPAQGYTWSRVKRVRKKGGDKGTTTHIIEPAVNARWVRLNVTRPSYSGEDTARIYEFEVYGPDGKDNIALNRPVTGSAPCSDDRGPEKAVNGSVSGGKPMAGAPTTGRCSCRSISARPKR